MPYRCETCGVEWTSVHPYLSYRCWSPMESHHADEAEAGAA